MQSEQFDSKAKDAAERHHPAYDENAWARMEKLLDKHLPQEKDGKRRIAVILLLLLFLGAGGILLVNRPWQNGKLSRNQRFVPGSPDGKESDGTTKAIPPSENKIVEKTLPVEVERTETLPTSSPKTMIPDLSFVEKKNRTRRSNPEILFTQDIVLKKASQDQNNQNREAQKESPGPPAGLKSETATSAAPLTKESVAEKTKEPVAENIKESIAEKTKEPVAENTEESVAEKTKEPAAENTKESIAEKIKEPAAKKTKPAQRPQSRFFITLSSGPDVSSAGLEHFGRMLFTYGAGVGYRIGDKFTLRSGVYSSRKLYSASPYDYHPPDNFWQFYTSLRKVNADCKVLEIPLSLSYNIHSNEKRTWFGSLGMSSYIMKRETYDYIYKNSWGTMSSWVTTIRNKNEHYFSVLGLSAGYQKRINNTLSFMAEPYLKIPLTGVGYGKVKLASAGILFSVGIHAPKNNKKKN